MVVRRRKQAVRLRTPECPAAAIEPLRHEHLLQRPDIARRRHDLFQRLPADGTLVEGRTHLDESMLTGESLPVAREPGDSVAGGALNGEGLIVVRTTLPRMTPRKPRRRISRSTVQRATATPSRFSCRQTLSAP